MGKTWTRNPNEENYRGDVKRNRKANKAQRKDRRKAERMLDENMERDEDDVCGTTDRTSDNRHW